MENSNPLATETAEPSWVPTKIIRKARRKERRYANQADRTRIREDLQAGLRDPECFLDLESRRKNTRKLLASGAAERRWLLDMQRKKVKGELANTRDLDTFLQKTSRSRTLYALIAMGFFRHVLGSEEYREDHRYKLAIRRALEEPGLCKAIQRKWENFDREFPDRMNRITW
ncbi:MAG: hypothetical protein JWP91_1375 [Fibrobacteres bacterium]|nr:hypothetical protein [Fibrobacterota bacterium]